MGEEPATQSAEESAAQPGREPTAAAEGATAWQLPETRRCYAAYRLGALRWFAAGLASLTMGSGLSAYAVLVLARPGLGLFIVAAVIFGAIGLATGGGGLRRARRFRIGLQRAPWQGAELRVVGSHLRLVFDAGVAGPQQDDPQILDARLMATSRWRVREVMGHRGSEVLVCPVKGDGYVLTTPGLNNLYGLLPLAPRVGRYRR